LFTKLYILNEWCLLCSMLFTKWFRSVTIKNGHIWTCHVFL